MAETQAGKGSLPYDHAQAVGAVGSTGSTAANALASQADVVLGIGTRWTDFTTASRTAFGPGAKFVNCNIVRFDAAKNAGVAVVGDARATVAQLADAVGGWSVGPSYREESLRLARKWDAMVEHAYRLGHQPLPAQSEVIGVVNEVSAPRDVVVCAAGSMPGDLHKLWRTRDPKGYHVEYGYSCMGYEIAGGLGAKMAAPDREVYVLVGDGSYLMMAQELVTAVQENIKLTVVLVNNHGFASIGALSESVGAQRFGTSYRFRDESTGRLDGGPLPLDFAANAESLGVSSTRVRSIDELRTALEKAKAASGPVLVEVETDPLVPAPSSGSWWDVAVAEVSDLSTTVEARKAYELSKGHQRRYL